MKGSKTPKTGESSVQKPSETKQSIPEKANFVLTVEVKKYNGLSRNIYAMDLISINPDEDWEGESYILTYKGPGGNHTMTIRPEDTYKIDGEVVPFDKVKAYLENMRNAAAIDALPE
jgi:hypothetical protein